MTETMKNPRVYTRPLSSQQEYNIYLSGPLGAPENYIEELQVLREACEDDVVNIYFNGPGGRLATASQILSAYESCKATIVGHLEGECHSAHTLLFIGCDEWTVTGNATMLVHHYNAGVSGKGQELMRQAAALDEWCKRIAENSYKGFLTLPELEEVWKDQDMWLDHTEILERLEGVVKYRQSLEKEYNDELQVQLKDRLAEMIDDEEPSSGGVEKSTEEL